MPIVGDCLALCQHGHQTGHPHFVRVVLYDIEETARKLPGGDDIRVGAPQQTAAVDSEGGPAANQVGRVRGKKPIDCRPQYRRAFGGSAETEAINLQKFTVRAEGGDRMRTKACSIGTAGLHTQGGSITCPVFGQVCNSRIASGLDPNSQSDAGLAQAVF